MLCDVPLPLPDAVAVFFAAFVAFVVVFDDFAAFAMVDCLSSNEVEVAEVLESNDKGWQLAGAVMLQCSDYAKRIFLPVEGLTSSHILPTYQWPIHNPKNR